MIHNKHKAARTVSAVQAAANREGFHSSIRTPILSQYYKNVYSVNNLFSREAA